MKSTTITCDVVGCGEEGFKEVECCRGWINDDEFGKYKKLENPIKSEKTDLCKKHYLEWCKQTIKLLKMDKERK